MAKKNNFKPLFIRENSKDIFRQMAARKKTSMADLFDNMMKDNCKLPPMKIDLFFSGNSFIKNKPKKFNNKRANVILDTGLAFIVLAAVILGIFYLSGFNNELKDLINSEDNISPEIKNLGLNQMNNYETRNDNSIIVILGFLWVTVIASSFLLDTNPIFFIVSFILLIGLLTGVFYFGNSMEEIINDDFVTVIPQFPNMYFIATHMIEVLLIMAGSIFISLFAKRQIIGG